MQATHTIPSMPPLGYPERYYSAEVRRAEQNNDLVLRHALKVAQYVTLALDPQLPWLAKQRFFDHAMYRHCNAPAVAPDAVNYFYDSLKTLVQKHAGEEAMRICAQADDEFAKRIRRGENALSVRRDAAPFFTSIVKDPSQRPEYFSRTVWRELVVFHDQWVRNVSH